MLKTTGPWDERAARRPEPTEETGERASGDLEGDAVRRLELRDAVLSLAPRDQDLIALRYGADLKARQIADLLGERTNTVEVALHRALRRLRAMLEEPVPEPLPEREAEAHGV